MGEHMVDIVDAVLLGENLKGKVSDEVRTWHLPSLHHIVRVLEEQEGYVKVVRCKDCQHWDPILPEVYEKLGIKEDIKLGLCWNEDERNQYLQCATEEKFYCALSSTKES